MIERYGFSSGFQDIGFDVFMGIIYYIDLVLHDIVKAEENYGRAILASLEDVEILSLYAKFTWETHNDVSRNEAYFVRAMKAAPDVWWDIPDPLYYTFCVYA